MPDSAYCDAAFRVLLHRLLALRCSGPCAYPGIHYFSSNRSQH